MIAEGCPEFGHPAVVPFQTEKAGATNMAYTGALERQEVGGRLCLPDVLPPPSGSFPELRGVPFTPSHILHFGVSPAPD